MDTWLSSSQTALQTRLQHIDTHMRIFEAQTSLSNQALLSPLPATSFKIAKFTNNGLTLHIQLPLQTHIRLFVVHYSAYLLDLHRLESNDSNCNGEAPSTTVFCTESTETLENSENFREMDKKRVSVSVCDVGYPGFVVGVQSASHYFSSPRYLAGQSNSFASVSASVTAMRMNSTSDQMVEGESDSEMAETDEVIPELEETLTKGSTSASSRQPSAACSAAASSHTQTHIQTHKQTKLATHAPSASIILEKQKQLYTEKMEAEAAKGSKVTNKLAQMLWEEALVESVPTSRTRKTVNYTATYT